MNSVGDLHPPRSSGHERFAGLDLLRGIAAIAILSRHYIRDGDWDPLILPRSYLAVDLFFVLSGFVIAHAYGARLRSGLGVGRFALVRLVRLYPVFALCMLGGAALTLSQLARAGASMGEAGAWFSSLALSLLFLPTPDGLTGGSEALFPLNTPAWSLFWEMAVNLLFAGLALRLGKRALAGICALALAALVVAGAHHGTLDIGIEWSTASGGAARALYGFFAGVGVFHLHSVRRAPSWDIRLIGLGLVLTLVPASAGPAGILDLVTAAVVFPALVWLGANASAGARTAALGTSIGQLSYPLYLVQGLVAVIVAGAAMRLGVGLSAHVWPLFAAYCLASVAAAWAIARWYDQPVRAWIGGRFALRSEAAAQSAP